MKWKEHLENEFENNKLSIHCHNLVLDAEYSIIIEKKDFQLLISIDSNTEELTELSFYVNFPDSVEFYVHINEHGQRQLSHYSLATNLSARLECTKENQNIVSSFLNDFLINKWNYTVYQLGRIDVQLKVDSSNGARIDKSTLVLIEPGSQDIPLITDYFIFVIYLIIKPFMSSILKEKTFYYDNLQLH